MRMARLATMRSGIAAFLAVATVTLLAACGAGDSVMNNPHAGDERSNTLYTAFTGRSPRYVHGAVFWMMAVASSPSGGSPGRSSVIAGCRRSAWGRADSGTPGGSGSTALTGGPLPGH